MDHPNPKGDYDIVAFYDDTEGPEEHESSDDNRRDSYHYTNYESPYPSSPNENPYSKPPATSYSSTSRYNVLGNSKSHSWTNQSPPSDYHAHHPGSIGKTR